MIRSLAGALLIATAAAGVLVPPAEAATTRAGAAASVTEAAAAVAAKPHLIRYKIYFGRCKDTCRIKVRITNTSSKRLYSVSVNARLKVNNRKVGSCHDYVGQIRPKGVRWGGCTVRTRSLSKMWNRWLDGEIRFDKQVNTVVHYEYYR
ncbi:MULTISPECIES: hypothetical protein [Nonomuraea]|uniref:hypothetical protein n=1 Tax=Nonomuraea TaxID=83681 RepID=UPI001C5E8D33|nr:hypothetical protein [Nonomuraea ceibae]